jgi:hypothetical protein
MHSRALSGQFREKKYRMQHSSIRSVAIMIVVFLALACSADRGDVRQGDTSEIISDADLREYRLTDDGVERWHRLQLRSAAEPELRVPEAESLEAPEGMSAAAATNMVRVFNRTPPVAAAIREGGMSPREFVLITFALYHALAAPDTSSLPPEALTNPQNVAYVTANVTRLNRFNAERVEAGQRAAERKATDP